MHFRVDIQTLEPFLIKRSFPAGHALWTEGDTNGRLVLLDKGRVKLFAHILTGVLYCYLSSSRITCLVFFRLSMENRILQPLLHFMTVTAAQDVLIHGLGLASFEVIDSGI